MLLQTGRGGGGPFPEARGGAFFLAPQGEPPAQNFLGARGTPFFFFFFLHPPPFLIFFFWAPGEVLGGPPQKFWGRGITPKFWKFFARGRKRGGAIFGGGKGWGRGRGKKKPPNFFPGAFNFPGGGGGGGGGPVIFFFPTIFSRENVLKGGGPPPPPICFWKGKGGAPGKPPKGGFFFFFFPFSRGVQKSRGPTTGGGGGGTPPRPPGVPPKGGGGGPFQKTGQFLLGKNIFFSRGGKTRGGKFFPPGFWGGFFRRTGFGGGKRLGGPGQFFLGFSGKAKKGDFFSEGLFPGGRGNGGVLFFFFHFDFGGFWGVFFFFLIFFSFCARAEWVWPLFFLSSIWDLWGWGDPVGRFFFLLLGLPFCFFSPGGGAVGGNGGKWGGAFFVPLFEKKTQTTGRLGPGGGSEPGANGKQGGGHKFFRAFWKGGGGGQQGKRGGGGGGGPERGQKLIVSKRAF